MEASSSVPEPDPIRTAQNDAITFTAGIVGLVLSVALLVAAEITSNRVILLAAVTSGIAVLVSWGMMAIAAAMILPSSQRELINEGPIGGKHDFNMGVYLGFLGVVFIPLALTNAVAFSEFSRFMFMAAGGFSASDSGVSTWLRFGLSQLADGLSFGLASIYIEFDAIYPNSLWSKALIVTPYRLVFSLFVVFGLNSAFKAIRS